MSSDLVNPQREQNSDENDDDVPSLRRRRFRAPTGITVDENLEPWQKRNILSLGQILTSS